MSRTRVPNAELYRDTARQNLLTNGGFEIWQRGTAGFTANGAYSADRWLNGLAGSSALSVVQRTPNAPFVCSNSQFSLGFTYSHNAESFIYQKIEDFSQLRGQTVSFSIMVYTTTANHVRPFLQVGGANTYGTYHTGSSSFERLTVTLAIPTNGSSVVCGVALNASGTSYLDNAMLVIGNVPADYAPLHPADDLARCLRYYEPIGTPGGNDVAVQMYSAAGSTFGQTTQFRAIKPVTPTVTLVGTWQVANCAQPAMGGSTVTGTRLQAVATAQGQASFTNGAGCWISVESNP